MRAFYFAFACLAILTAVWGAGISAIRDAGGYSESHKTWRHELTHRGHAFSHVVGSAATFGVGAAWGVAPWIVALITFGAWTLVEVAQRYPRVKYASGKPGRFSEFDLAANALGIALAWGVVVVIR